VWAEPRVTPESCRFLVALLQKTPILEEHTGSTGYERERDRERDTYTERQRERERLYKPSSTSYVVAALIIMCV